MQYHTLVFSKIIVIFRRYLLNLIFRKGKASLFVPLPATKNYLPLDTKNAIDFASAASYSEAPYLIFLSTFGYLLMDWIMFFRDIREALEQYPKMCEFGWEMTNKCK